MADPFIVKEGDTFYMFYEANVPSPAHVEIVYSTSPDGITWTYQKSVLKDLGTPLSFSYPVVFKVSGSWYMLPCKGDNSVVLYRAVNFPDVWQQLCVLMVVNYHASDPTLIQWGDYWYLFIGDTTNINLRLYYSDRMYGGTWTEHPSSPLYAADGARNTRPGGRPIIRASAIDIPLQDSVIIYGNKVRIYRITELTPTSYTASELETSPLIEGDGSGWNTLGMHTLDRVNSDLSIVDGYDDFGWYIGIYQDVP